MAKDIEEKIGAMSQKNWHVLNYKNPLKNYRVHEMPTGDQLPPNSWNHTYPLCCEFKLPEHSRITD